MAHMADVTHGNEGFEMDVDEVARRADMVASDGGVDEGSAGTYEDSPSGRLCVVMPPECTSWRAGETIRYAGLIVVECDGEDESVLGRDVTGELTFEPAEGSAFPADRRRITVVARDAAGRVATFEISRKRKVLPIVFAVCAALCVACGIWFAVRGADRSPFPEGDTGSYFIPQGEMTDEEAQALVDEMAEKSRITVNLAPSMALRSDGSLRVNLVVPKDNNGLSERLEVEQDGRVVYRSGIVEEGSRLEWGTETDGAHAGAATATVYAMQDGADFGNPVSVEVEIVDAKGE